MPDDKTKRHPHDGKRIDINDPQEIRNWCETFECSKGKLIAAVMIVGDSAKAVEKYLDK